MAASSFDSAAWGATLAKIYPTHEAHAAASVNAIGAATLVEVLDASEDAVFFKDLDGRYLFINEAGARMLQRSRADVVGRSDGDLFAPSTASKMIARDRAIMASGATRTYEDTGILDDRTRTYRSTKGLLRDSGDVVVGLWGLSRDVTDEQRNRAEREELALELRVRHEQLTDVEAKLAQSERLATLGRLAAVLAHEIRNPLAVILNATSIARQKVGSSSEGSVLDIIKEEVGRLNDLVTDLLDFARPPLAVFLPTALGPLVERVVERVLTYDAAWASHALRLRLVGTETSAIVSVDERLFLRALVNVLDNARQAMGAEGMLTIEVTTTGGTATVRVSDTGHGLSALARQNLFQPFFTTKATGTGLGLYVVKRIFEDHGGEARVVSDERGTSVLLLLPITTRD